jgi:hypothetical protein
MLDEIDKLLKMEWECDQKMIIQKMIDNMKTYKYFLTNAIKGDIQSIFVLAINIKSELDELKTELQEIKKELVEIKSNQIQN